jgi:hypothetical protein
LEVPSIVDTHPWGMNGSRVEWTLMTLLKFPQYIYTSMGMNEFRVQGASITRMKFPFPSSKQAFGHNYHSYYSRHNEPTPNNAPWAWMDSGWTENTFPLSSNPLVNHSVSWNSTDGWMDKHHQERRCSKFLPLFQLDIFLLLEGEILVKWVMGFKRYLCVFFKFLFLI